MPEEDWKNSGHQTYRSNQKLLLPNYIWQLRESTVADNFTQPTRYIYKF